MLWSAVFASFCTVLVIGFISHLFLPEDYPYLIASMGAAVVLVFLAPGNLMAQPWAVLMGHLVSAFVGVTCAKFIPSHVLAAAAGISVAIFAMHYLRCLHPPGGAAALIPVVGDQHIADLGYWYVLAPTGINAVVLLLMAILCHKFLTHRAYPADYSKLKNSGNSNDYVQRDPFVGEYINPNKPDGYFCKEVMSPVTMTVLTSATCDEAKRLLAQQSQDELVAVNGAGRFAGVVTATSLALGALSGLSANEERAISDLEILRVATVREDLPVVEARELLEEQGLDQVIVVDCEYRPVGRLTSRS